MEIMSQAGRTQVVEDGKRQIGQERRQVGERRSAASKVLCCLLSVCLSSFLGTLSRKGT